MVRHAFRVLTDDSPDPADRLLRRHGRAAQGARQRPEPGHAGGASRQAADAGARPVRNEYPAFGAHNNARLRAFLDRSASTTNSCPRPTATRPAASTPTLLKMLERFDAIMEIMLPTLREERAQTYSPFLPISPRTGIVLQVPVVAHDAEAGTIAYDDPETKRARDHAGHRRALPSCNGRPTGRCAGSRSASITRWPART